MNTEEGNKLIAAFMGYRRQNDNDDENDGTSAMRYKHWHLGERGHFDDSDLLYHWSWDWQIPVWGKIAAISQKVAAAEEYATRHNRLCDTYEAAIFQNNIEVGFITIVNAIQWYNSLQPKT